MENRVTPYPQGQWTGHAMQGAKFPLRLRERSISNRIASSSKSASRLQWPAEVSTTTPGQ
ncbi:MAG: hypothetical protein HXX10_26405 [Rhodoplanes sp.]|uniref:hypothetical protein n=1 Tax=Rhodoplanes sp. TaxID=1968906 RepID=UPI0017FA0B90|nr:hypothetical protein [Rhodoplanes sp.]NVO17576.1 hypothetical protein [Rhodoplanes sp.]